MIEFKGKYEEIVESTIVRYQSGGVMIGDLVKINPKALKHPKLKDLGDHVKANIKKLIDHPLNLKVSAVKSIHPSLGSFSDGLGTGTTTAPTDFWCDVVIETAPGLFSDPMTLPIEVLEVIDLGGNLTPIPDELKRKGDVNITPKDAEYVDNYSIPDHDTRTMTKKNVKLKYTKGSAKMPVLKDSVHHTKKDDQVNLIEAYSQISGNQKPKIYTVMVANAFADNVERFLTTENIKTEKRKDGHKTLFNVMFEDSKIELEKILKENVMGDLTFLKVFDADQQLDENQ